MITNTVNHAVNNRTAVVLLRAVQQLGGRCPTVGGQVKDVNGVRWCFVTGLRWVRVDSTPQ